MKRFFVIFLTLVLFNGCFGTKDKFPHIKLTWESIPKEPVVGEITFYMEFRNEKGAIYPLGEVDVEAFMKGQLAIMTKAMPKADGQWESVLNLSKPGEWKINVTLREMNGDFAHKQFSLNIK